MMPKPNATVFVVDDDAAVCASLVRLIGSVGLNVETYSHGQMFLDAYDESRPGCLVLDIRMPGMGGLEVQKILVDRGVMIPIIIITGHGDVPLAVQTLRAGAIDFIEKPFRPQELLDRINEALEHDAESRSIRYERATIEERRLRLSPREREVMELLIEGKPIKRIAMKLSLSPKTVHFHRTRILEKMEAETVVDLVRHTAVAIAK